MKNKHLLIILLTFCAGQVLAQTTPEKSNYGLPKPKEFDRWSAGITFGVSHLLSDMLKGEQNNNRFLKEANINPAFGIQLHHQVSHSIGIRARGIFTKFSGADEEFIDSVTNQSILIGNITNTAILVADKFETNVTEGSLEMTYNFGNISFLNRNKNFHFVSTLGIGFFNFDTEVTLDSANERVLRRSGNITEIMIPVSLGFKYKINKFDIGLALEYRKSFTDKVDATVKTYSEFDSYVMLNAGLNYTFGKKNKPMEWVNPMEVVYNDLADMKEKIDILSGDKDKDGVSDLFDKDNNTEEGTKVYGDGTSIDTDGDGVADSKDADPFTAKGATVDANGQETDTDADGVADSRDLEPGTEPGSLVNFQGITIAKPGSFGKDGLSGNDGTGYLPSVFFDLGSAVVKSVYHDRMLVIAKVLKSNPDLKIMISGNCDVTGSENENNRLGMRRAENVKNHLIKQYGIDASRLSTESKGEKDPMANTLNTMNRRVDFSIQK